MSNGNVEQPTAQTPRGHNSPNGVEVSEEGRQGAPASNAQGQERSNGQSREAREEQLAHLLAVSEEHFEHGPILLRAPRSALLHEIVEGGGAQEAAVRTQMRPLAVAVRRQLDVAAVEADGVLVGMLSVDKTNAASISSRSVDERQS